MNTTEKSLTSLMALHRQLVLTAHTTGDWQRVHMAWTQIQQRAANLGITDKTFVANAITKSPKDRTDDEQRAIKLVAGRAQDMACPKCFLGQCTGDCR